MYIFELSTLILQTFSFISLDQNSKLLVSSKIKKRISSSMK